jgi:hypothetical protein
MGLALTVALGSCAGGQYAVMASPTVDKTSGKHRRKRHWLQFGLPTLLALAEQSDSRMSC